MENSTVLENSSRLRFFPIMFFAVIMGLSGLTLVLQKSSELFGLPSIFWELFTLIDTGLFFIILSLYIFKLSKYPNEVKHEFSHPIRINFFAAISISLLLLATIYHEFSIEFAKILFFSGIVLHTYFTLYTISFWINHNFEITHSNPAWFIPIVGNLLIPVAGAGLVSNELLIFYFSIGMLFWVVLFTVIFYRIIFHHQLAQKFIPTLFILIAPPAVGFIGYIKMGYGFDFFAHFLLDMGLFFTILLFFMYKNFLNLKFFISWWAFTFPLAAITIATMLAYKITKATFYMFSSYFLIALTIFVVLFVTYKTVVHIQKKDICVAE